MKLSTLANVLSAVHLSSFVDSPFESRGGLMLVAPVGALKTSLIRLLDEYPGVCGVSDLNTRSLKDVRDEIVAGKIRTLTVYDIQKLYERKADTSSNIEGTLRAMVDEGFTSFSDEPQRAIQSRARVTFISGMPNKFYRESLQGWDDSGFSRRFLWSIFRVTNIEKLLDAIESWKCLELQAGLRFGVPSEPRSIPMSITAEERAWLRRMIRFQHGDVIPLQLMIKVMSVLRWRFCKLHKKDDSAKIIEDFGASLSKDGGEVEI